MAARKKLSREERLERKREAERLRYQRIKNDPEKYAQQKDKERKKYDRKKEKGTIKTVNKMTPREQRKARKLWREKAAKRRRRLALKNSSNAPTTPPSSDDEAARPALVPLNENIDKRAEAAKQKSIRARKARNLLIQKQADQIAKLKSTVLRYKKRQRRSRKAESQPEEPTPNTKVNAACKSAADRAVANGTDISSLEDLHKVLQKGCPNINVLSIDTKRITEKEAQIGSGENIKTFAGTLRIHQVTGSVFILNRITMKSLSCFCDLDLCNHFVIGTSNANQISRLRVEDIYGSDSHSEDEPLSSLASRQDLEKFRENPLNSETISCSGTKQCDDDDQQTKTSGRKVLNNGDFVLVKLIHRKTEYRYVARCTGVEEDDEIQVIFCKSCDDTGKNFKIDDIDIAFIQWDQIIEDLPIPNIKMKRMFYSFHHSIKVFEQN